MSVDVSTATLRSAVGRMSVVCQWCIGSMSVMYSSQYPSSNGGILPNTPSASERSKFQQFLVIFCTSKIKLLWRQSFITAMPQGSSFDWCWCFLTRKMALSFPSCRKEGHSLVRYVYFFFLLSIFVVAIVLFLFFLSVYSFAKIRLGFQFTMHSCWGSIKIAG